jgi:hypothetical protein
MANKFFNNKLTSKLIAGSLLVAGIAGIAPKAMAEDFIFQSNVAPACAFNSSYSTALNLTSKTFSGSTTGVAINCNVPTATLNITNITEDAANPTKVSANTKLSATANLSNANTGNITATGAVAGTPVSLSTLGTTNVGLSMTADLEDRGTLAAGLYRYTVVMTLTP